LAIVRYSEQETEGSINKTKQEQERGAGERQDAAVDRPKKLERLYGGTRLVAFST
jgi:hypothetical protein